MGIRRMIRSDLIEKLPNKYQFFIERLYTYHCVRNYVETDVRIMKQLCNPHKNALDVGANQGVFTLFLCKFSSYVYCFEPVPRLGEYLKNRFHGCNVSVENCALGNFNGELYLNIPCVESGKLETRSSLAIDFENEYILGEKVTDVEKIKVNVRRLDDFHINNVGFIKLDVEGFEFQVLEGGKETIKQNMPNMLIEIEKRHHKKDNIYDIFQYIIDLGYFGYFICNKKLRKSEEFDVMKMQNHTNEKSKDYINNFIFSPSPISNLKI